MPALTVLSVGNAARGLNRCGRSKQGGLTPTNAIDQAQFIAIGGDHLTREIPLFTSHVCDQMSRHGLDAIARVMSSPTRRKPT